MAKKSRRRHNTSRTIRRQWSIGMFLQKRAWTIHGIAAAFKISKATAQRDIDILRGLFKVTAKGDPRHSQRIWYRMRGRFVPIL